MDGTLFSHATNATNARQAAPSILQQLNLRNEAQRSQFRISNIECQSLTRPEIGLQKK